MTTGCINRFEILSREAGCSNDMNNARLGCDGRQFERRLRSGEINHAIGMGQRGERIIGNADPQRPQTRQSTNILTQCWRAFALQRASQNQFLTGVNGLNEHAPHAPCRTCHHQSHIRHCKPLLRRSAITSIRDQEKAAFAIMPDFSHNFFRKSG